MRHHRILVPTVILAASAIVLSACSSSSPSSDSSSSASASSKSITVSAPLSGQLGDKSFMDSANSGLQRAAKELGAKVKVIEAGSDDAPAWERNLTEASASGDNDLIVTGGTVVASTLKKVAAQFPDQKYLIFDSPSVGKNVTGISYAQNEGAFLVGALAAYITDNPDLFPRAKGTKKIGVAGGMDIPVIQDFVTGFKQGALAVDPDITVDVRFINDFASAQKGYDIATAQYKDGADVVYQVAGAAGLGVLQAGDDAGRYAIGTDSDQNALHPDSIAASALKSVDNTVFNGIKAFEDGTLKPGTTISGDIANDGVGIVYNDKLVPQSIQDKIDALRKQVVSGQIKVKSAL